MTRLKLKSVMVLIVTFLCAVSCKHKPGTPTVVTTSISDITEVSATSGGEITNDGKYEIIGRGVCWSTSSNPTISDNITEDGSGTGVYESTLSGLTEGTLYYTRAYATNSMGTSYGSEHEFTTLSPGNEGDLIIEGQTFTNNSSKWYGVNIPRRTRTSFIFRNNSVTSTNAEGYLLQAGDEGPASTNNNLDGEEISGNKFVWNGTNVASSITHGIFAGYNINVFIGYNYLNKIPTGIVLKSNGMSYTSGGVAYNIINKTGTIGIAVKGINGTLIYNNTFYSDEVKYTSKTKPGTSYALVDIFANDGISPLPHSTNTKIKNNIFYTVHQIANISIQSAEELPGFESDYNIFWCEEGAPMFKYLGNLVTFEQWQTLGFDTHSVVKNPEFIDFTDFVPANRLDFGIDLGASWQTGLTTTAKWVVGSAPDTTNQNGPWQVGARLY